MTRDPEPVLAPYGTRYSAISINVSVSKNSISVMTEQREVAGRRPVLQDTSQQYQTLKDILGLSVASSEWSQTQKTSIFPILASQNITLTTCYRDDDGHEVPEGLTLYPVIKRLYEERGGYPEQLHKDLLVFEQHLEDRSYEWNRNKYEPTELVIRIGHIVIKYPLLPDPAPARYEVRRDNDTYIPSANAKSEGPQDRFTIFEYIHKMDVKKEYPLRVYYRHYEDPTKFRLHCVGIPLGFLRLLLDGAEDDADSES